MMDTHFLESFLRLNNLSANASTVDITAALTQAHWTPQQIEEALLVHANGGTPTASQELAQKQRTRVFRPDMDWTSSKLSSLLGIDVVVDPASFHPPSSGGARAKETGKKLLVGLGIAVAAVVVAAGIGIGLMYLFEVGPFYTRVADIL